MHEQAIQHYFADKEPMLVEAVSRLVRIDSTLGPALPGKPFGEGPAAALEELLALARSWGLSGQNLEGYVGTVDLNDQETVLHILGHLDVVDPGEGWTVTEAFVPKLVDGLLYGRGTDDDKSKLLGSGTHDVDGRTWVVYQSGDATKAWITDLGQVRIALMSKGPDSDLTTLASLIACRVFTTENFSTSSWILPRLRTPAVSISVYFSSLRSNGM